MITTLWNDFITTYKSILGTGAILVLFVVALIILHFDKNDEENSKCFFLSIWGTIGLAFVKTLKKAYEIEDENKYKNWLGRLFVIVLMIFVVSISGKRIFSTQFLSVSENNLHMEQNLVDAFDSVLSENETETKILMMPGYGTYVSAYSSMLKPAYEEPRNGDVSKYPAADMEAYLELNKKSPNMYKVSKAAEEDDCQYILLKDEVYWPKVPLTQLGFEEYGRFGEWILYKSQREVNE